MSWRPEAARDKSISMPSERPDPRRPDETPSAAIGPLAALPVFFRLAGKRALVSGGSEAAAWKARLLAASGASVDVYSVEVSAGLRQLAGSADAVILHARTMAAADFAGAAIAISAAETDAEAAAFQAAAKAAGVPVNVIDKPRFSDFQFGAIVERSPLVIAISTDGAAPVFGQALRARIEAMLPQNFRHWANAAKSWRPRVQALKPGFQARRRFWEEFSKLAFAQAGRVPRETDIQALLQNISEELKAPATGSVALVGAGPGDPELLTLKAVRALQSADVILYDDLILPGALDFARREATKLNVGKRGYKPSCTQEDICAILIGLASEGKRVVRLKGGDPMIFGRANEEINALQSAGIPVESIPGVTSASAAAAALGVSLTERVTSRRLQFITAHARNGKLPEDLDWRALADPKATTAVYMGRKTLALLSARLIAEGLPPETPAILMERVSWEGERRIAGTIAGLPALAEAAALSGPCMVLIGAAMAGAKG